MEENEKSTVEEVKPKTVKVKEITDEAIPVKEIKPKKVMIKQCRKSGLPVEAGHDGEYRYTGAAEHLTVQFRRGTKELITGLTEENERYFEKKLNLPGKSDKMPGGTLSRYNHEFWAKFKIVIPKGGKTLDIENNPWDELEWKVLLVHQEVANSEEDRQFNGFARYVLTSEEEEAETTNVSINLKKRAYDKFGKMSMEDMKDYLRVWSHTHTGTLGRITDATKNSMIEAVVGKIVDEQSQEFLDILSDATYRTRVFLKKCLDKGIMKKENTKYMLAGGDVVGYTIEQAIDYLRNVDNQEVVLSLKARLEANK